jgi:hypothetical protein
VARAVASLPLDPLLSDELWANAHNSLGTRQKSFGLDRALPRLAGSRDSKYLLGGFVRCFALDQLTSVISTACRWPSTVTKKSADLGQAPPRTDSKNLAIVTLLRCPLGS